MPDSPRIAGAKGDIRSSSRRLIMLENSHSTKVGCISGFFRLLHSSSRRRLTSAKPHQPSLLSNASRMSPAKAEIHAESHQDNEKIRVIRVSENCPGENAVCKLSSKLDRSPALPAEARHSDLVKSEKISKRNMPLVAVLMGLDLSPPPPESPAEKRRKLLKALQKCDEDLDALKKIIQAVRVTEERSKRIEKKCEVTSLGADDLITNLRKQSGFEWQMSPEKEKTLEVIAEQPSPVSVLDVADDAFSPNLSPTRASQTGAQKHLQRIEVFGNSRRLKTGVHDKLRKQNATNVRASRALLDGVNEVWKDGSTRERLELESIVCLLNDQVFRGLLEELVLELGSSCGFQKFSERCRKKLIF